MQRISVVGNPGAGKSTFSRALGQILGVEVVELDRLFGHIDKVRLTQAEREARLSAALDNPRFIIDGGFPWTYLQRIACCDTIIWIDLGMGRHFLNVLRRSWRAPGPEGAEAGGGKRFRDRFPPHAFWVGFLNDHGTGIIPIRTLFANPPKGLRLIRLQSHAEADAFLAGLAK